MRQRRKQDARVHLKKATENLELRKSGKGKSESGSQETRKLN